VLSGTEVVPSVLPCTEAVPKNVAYEGHGGRPQRRGGGLIKCGHMRTGDGIKDLADVRKLVLFYCFSIP